MKSKLETTSWMAATALALAVPLAQAAGESHEALMAEAKVTSTEATATALAAVPQGTVKSSELEREHGRLIWTFDIAQPKVKGVTEIHVDAKTGKIVLSKKESAFEEAKEARAAKAQSK